MTKEKDCDCSHSIQAHELIQKGMSKLDYVLILERFVIQKEGRGECMICHCPKYEPPKRFTPRWGMDYSLRKKPDAHEKRCTRCGRLLENHVDVNHSFQYGKTPLG